VRVDAIRIFIERAARAEARAAKCESFYCTVTVAVALFAKPQALLTLTQYDTVAVGRTVSDGPVPSLIGVAVLPEEPTYH
jgi:hypothetical protein